MYGNYKNGIISFAVAQGTLLWLTINFEAFFALSLVALAF